MVVKGNCPTLGKEYSIDVDYVPSSTLRETTYIKDRFECGHASYGGNCTIDCPIYESAPEHIR